jgi:hypothetical protein
MPEQKLRGFDDDDLHPQVLEAIKRLQIAKDGYDNAVASIDGQYLVSLSGAEAGAQADAVRALF